MASRKNEQQMGARFHPASKPHFGGKSIDNFREKLELGAG
jgi:hypothetical protein